MFSGWPFWIIGLIYLPVLCAAVVIVRYARHIKPLWYVILGVSLFSGGAPLVALLFLAAHRRMVSTPPADSAAASIPQPAQSGPLYPEPSRGALASADTVATSGAASAIRSAVTAKPATTAFGMVVTCVLWVSGLAMVGVFLFFVIALIKCANDPKCM